MYSFRMSTQILTTKLYIPPPRPKVVLRARLIERLNEGLGSKLTLISAPAGFGKTTLVSEWLADSNRSVAWLSLDEGDNDPTRFLTYLVSALQTISADLGKGLLSEIHSPQPPPSESILTALTNEINGIPDPFIFILDDYHVLDSQSIDKILTFLIEHSPPKMHLVITTREDPQLPLARLRARGQLSELRAADLRFTSAEAAAFLKQVMGLDLSLDDVDTLEARTEGWIAGLQLAALSLQGHQDVSEFIREFAGDHRYIVDYLVEEVLQRQPESVRRFLLQTAILDRLTGSLCDAVTGQAEGSARLETLMRGNFFVVPLDENRHWFRYHHLFADVLHAHLLMEQPDQVPILHLRASQWYERHGSAADAIRHALAAEDFERAAVLIEQTIPVMVRNRQEKMLLGWLQALPEETLRDRPVLSVYFAGTLLQNGQIEGVEAKLRFAEQWLETDVLADDARPKPRFVDEAEFRSVPASIAMYRSAIALASGDADNTIHYARQVFELAPEDDLLRRASASGLLGLAHWTRGELAAAGQAYFDSMTGLQRLAHISDVAGLSIGLAGIQLAQGRLREAMSTYDRALKGVTESGSTTLRGAGDMHVGLSELYRERNDLDAAEQHVLQSQTLGEWAGLPQNRYRQRIAMARIREAQGDLDGAIALLDEAEKVYANDLFPNVRPIEALKARIWTTQGDLSKALDWARDQQLSSEDDLRYLREFEHITLARVMLAQQTLDRSKGIVSETIGFLERLLQAANEGGRTGSMIEILILLALSHQAQGNTNLALGALERALTLAEPEGYVRIFVDEGPPMAALLEKAAQRGVTPHYVRQLLGNFGNVMDRALAKQNLIEPLSDREFEVLRLLGTDLDGPELARELTVSLNTLRTHTKNIYTKLGVNSRRAAVRRAEELGLL
jgi:LuxR family maltose regulon positive regulatory protein